MNILITGGGVVNKGAETMIRTVQDQLGNRIENPTFFIEKSEVVQGTESQYHAIGIKIIERKIPNKLSRLINLIGLLLFFPGLASQILKRRDAFWGWKKLIQDIDGIIDISGYRYGEGWGVKYAISALPIVYYSWLGRKPYIFLPQTWGPFDKHIELFRLCRWMCKRSSLLFARDKQSQQYLSILLSEDIDSIPLAPEIAFLFTPSNIYENQIEEIIRKFDPYEKFVGIVPNMRVYERARGKGTENIYIKKLISLCNLFIENGKVVVLIPHEINPQPKATDDRFLSSLIYEKVERKSRVIFINDVVSSDFLKIFLSKCELIISSRFHAVVAALELCKAVVVIGWSHKYEELLKDAGLDEFVLDYDEEFAEIVKIVQKAERESNAITSKLEQATNRFKLRGGDVFDQVSALLYQAKM